VVWVPLPVVQRCRPGPAGSGRATVR